MSLTGQQTRPASGSAPAARGRQANSRPGAPKRTGQMTMPPGRTWLWFLGILLANYLLMTFLFPNPDAPVTVPYTLFKDEVGKGNVEAIVSRGEAITGRFATPVTYTPPGRATAAPSGET